MTPVQVWQDYDAQGELDLYCNKESVDKNYCFSTYTFSALKVEDGSLKAVVDVVKSTKVVSDKAVLIVQEYHKTTQKAVIKNLIDQGYTVVIPDCSGIGKKYKTEFPPSLSYGKIENAGDHIKMVCPTAKETCQYLYSLITKRAITFINRELNINDIIIMGIGEASEVAMQVVGSDKRPKGLVCLNGAGYKEYLHLNKFGNKKELEIDQQLLCWLTGVASVAYAKHIEVPVMIALSSNSRYIDIDRLPNLLALLKEKSTSIVITPGSCNSISHYAYNTIVAWMDDVFNNRKLLKRPKISLNVSEGAVYAEVNADRSKDIKQVYVYYSVGEYDHLVRNWQKVECQSISKTQFIVKLDITKNKGPLFAFCDIIYKKDLSMSSLETYVELEDLDITALSATASRIVYEGNMGINSFTEESDKAILLKSGIKTKKTPMGLLGVTSDYGELISYDIGRYGEYNKGRILQIDAYSDKDVILEIKLTVKNGDLVEEYIASSSMIAGSGAFTSHKFFANEFKNQKMLSLDDWDNVKAIKFTNSGIIIGKILFI